MGDQLDWRAATRPARVELRGRHVAMRPLEAGDATALHAASSPDVWAYLPYGPFEAVEDFGALIAEFAASEDPLFFTFCPLPDERPAGVASYLRITPEHGTIEIGHIWLGPALQRTTAATEGIYLLARHAFDELGYRRLEWKCDALNGRSRRAAERFGFRFEGVFRKHMVVKGRNRDSAWFAITDDEWPRARERYEAWLDPANFDDDGRQRAALRAASAAA